MRIKLTVTYDGSFAFGWQRQTNKISIQQTLEEGILALTGEKVKVIGSGRTDAGVHAEGQVCHFDTKSSIPPKKFFLALNVYLPHFVKAVKSELASDNFNARSLAKSKTYRYSIYLSSVEKPLIDRYKTRIYGNLDIDKMREFADYLVGEHDFKAFCATGSTKLKSTVRTVYKIDIKKDGELYDFYISGNGFLYNMVRIMVGTLVKVGKGEISIETAKLMLDSKNRALGGDTLPAKGLTLMEVNY